MVSGFSDRMFDGVVYLLLALIGLAALFPVLYVVSVSLTPYAEVLRNGGYVVIPRSVTLAAYAHLLSRPSIPRAFAVTVFITVVGTAVNLLLTTLMAYPLSKRQLPGRNLVLLLVIFTMLFSGGVIPTYLIVRQFGLINSVWAMIVPSAISTFNVLVMKSFFESLPEELFEAARIDGAGELRVLLQIVLPLAVPIMLTVGLFYAVGHWNEYFQALMYVTDTTLQPLQVVIRGILRQASLDVEPDVQLPSATLQMAAVVFASLPLILAYPFIQRHFTKGILVGSLKG